MEFQIKQIERNKKQYLELLLIGDEQESMIDSYLGDGDMFVLFLNDLAVGVCVVTKESDRMVEIRNIAVLPDFRRMGLGSAMLEFVDCRYAEQDIQLGTGETPSTLKFYKSAGYRYSHRIKNFFTLNYDHSIIEEGVLLKDMIYLKKERQ